MTKNDLTQESGLKPEPLKDLNKSLLKNESKKTLAYSSVFALLAISMVVVNGVVNDTFKIEAFPAFILFMLMLISTIENIFIRLGNVIAGHKFYKAWLIYPITNIIILSTLFACLNIKNPDAFTFDNASFFIGCLMGSMVFIHTASVVRRGETEHYEISLKYYDDFDQKKVFMKKKQMWVYRLAFASLTFISLFILRLVYS